MKLLISTHAPYYWAKLNSKGALTEKGEVTDGSFLKLILKGITSIVGVVPGEKVTLHSVDVPTNRHANMLAAVPYTLEEKLSEDIDDLHFSVLNWKAGQAAQVAVISKQTVDSVIESFGGAANMLDSIVPDYAFLPLHSNGSATVARGTGDRYFLKEGEFKTAVMDEFAFKYWWQSVDLHASFAVNNRDLANEMKTNGGEDVNLWDIGENFTDWLKHGPLPDIQKISLLREAYEPAHLKPKNTLLNWSVGLAACALLSLGVSNWVELERMKDKYQANELEIKSLFAKTFPDQEYLDQPKRQIATLLSIDVSGGSQEIFQFLLEKVMQVAPQNKASFLEINFRNQALQVGVTAPNFAALEKMTSQIDEAAGVRAALVSSGSEANKVKGQIKLIASDS
ncbi:MAG: general secretion pathway protein L [Saprospiraceae bacterium]|jgi:general secretion pathway protein L